MAARFQVGVLDRGVHQPQGRDPPLVAAFHRFLQRIVDGIAQHGGLFSTQNRLFIARPPAFDGGEPGGLSKPLMSPKQDDSGWTEPKATALLVLADGTVLEGMGLGATGHAVGEVCFNTAMTGYEEILTDPSYAGQIITFTFPHIGNVGTNDDDIETVNMAATPGARGVILRTPITEPSNFRASAPSRRTGSRRAASSALAGIDTRALTALIREKGMPNAVIAHQRERQVRSRRAEAGGARVAGPRRHGPRADGDQRPALFLGRDALALGQGLSAAQTAPNSTWSRSTMASSATSCACSRASAARSRWCRRRPAPRTFSRSTRTACSSPTAPAIPPPPAQYAVPVIKKLIDSGTPDVRHLPRPPDAGHRARRPDAKDAPGPPRRQSSGQGPQHRQGRDHLDEPRLRGRPATACRRTSSRPMCRCSTARTAASRSRTGRCSRCSITRRPRPVRATAIICSRVSSS